MVVAIIISVVLIIFTFAIIFAVYSVNWDEEEFFKQNKPSYNSSQKSEIKPPKFTPPPAKKKVIHQEDLERLTCKACGAPLNKDLKCEYCGTQWYDGKSEVYTIDKDANKEIMIEYEWVTARGGKDNHIVARYEMTPKYTTYGMSMEEAAEVFTKLSKGVGVSGED